MTVVLVAAALLVAGCMQTQDDGTDGDDSMPEAVNPTVTLLEPTGDVQVTTGESITVRWSVDPASGDHEIPHVGVHWGPNSVDADSATGPGAYGNNEGVQGDVTVPDEFTTTFSFDEAGTYYLRAHAIADGGTNYWSSAEIMIDVQANGGSDEEPSQTVHTVEMVSAGFPGFDPMEITIQAGDGVQWENVDGTTHTATADDTSWDTGDVTAGATSSAITFDSPGTYDYECKYHGLMDGRIVVEA